MMKKYIVIMSFLTAWATSLYAANITRQQADVVVQNYLQEITHSGALYANVNEPDEAGISITTSNEETFKAKYACWVYCLDETTQRRYLFVKEENGSLLEIIASNDVSALDASWTVMNIIITNLVAAGNKENNQLLYPNPVSDLLTFPCNEKNTLVEIYDLKGARLFSGLLSETCQLNVSFLNAGIYIVNISGETYKIIKN